MDKQHHPLAVTDLQIYIDTEAQTAGAADRLTQRVKHCLALLDQIDDTIMFDLGQLSTPFDKELEGLRETLASLLDADATQDADGALSRAA